jgi:hypothetical protein
MDPFENLGLTGRGEPQELPVRRQRGLPIGLQLGADRAQVAEEELFAGHLEQAQRRLVRFDEPVVVGVDDRDGFRRVVDE